MRPSPPSFSLPISQNNYIQGSPKYMCISHIFHFSIPPFPWFDFQNGQFLNFFISKNFQYVFNSQSILNKYLSMFMIYIHMKDVPLTGFCWLLLRITHSEMSLLLVHVEVYFIPMIGFYGHSGVRVLYLANTFTDTGPQL